jgi:hypothetical protein
MSVVTNAVTKVGNLATNGYFGQFLAGPIEKLTPLTNQAGKAPFYTTEYISYRYITALLSILIPLVGIAYFITNIIGNQVIARIADNFREFIDKYINVDEELKYRVDDSRCKKITHRMSYWPGYLLYIIFSLFKMVFINLSFIVVMAALILVFLPFENHQNDLVDFMDAGISMSRSTYNIGASATNVVIKSNALAIIPIYNAMVEFIVQLILITLDYLVPIYLKSTRGGTGRVLVDANGIPFFGDEWFNFLRFVGEIHYIFLKIFFGFFLYLWEAFCFIFFDLTGGDSIGDLIKIIFNYLKGFYCYLEPDYFLCTVAQAFQIAIQLIAFVMNVLLNLVLKNLLGFSPINIPSNFISVQCRRPVTVSGKVVSNEACLRCKPAFPGWEEQCPDSTTRRLLVMECRHEDNPYDDFTPIHGKWRERLYYNHSLIYEGETYDDTTSWHGCSMTRTLLLNNPNHIYYKHYNNYHDCITVLMDGADPVNRCPSEKSLPYSHTHHGRRRLLQNGRRSLISLVDEVTKQKIKKETELQFQINRETFIKKYDALFEKEDKNKIFNCSDVVTKERVTQHTFDVLCGIQKLTTQDGIFKDLQAQFDPHSSYSSVYAKYRQKQKMDNARRALSENIDKLLYRLDLLVSDYYEGKEDIITPRRRELIGPTRPELTNVTFGDTGNGECLPGYQRCIGSNFCEVPGSCRCPSPTQVLNKYKSDLYVLYQTKCDIVNFSQDEWIRGVLKCWRDYRESDAHNPFAVISNTVQGGAITKKTYCYPLLDPEQILLPEIEEGYSFRESLISTYCKDNKTNNVMECACPGYKSGVYAYNGQFIIGINYYEYVRLYNGLRWWMVNFFAFLNLITFGFLNWVWSGFFTAFNGPDWLIQLFSLEAALQQSGCSLVHLGSWGWFNLTIFFFVEIFGKIIYPIVWILFRDFHFFGLVISGQKIKSLVKKYKTDLYTKGL